MSKVCPPAPVVCMVDAHLHRIDTALAEVFAKHLAPFIQTERVGLCMGEAFQLVDLDKVMATFRARNELPLLSEQIDEIAWQRTTNHRWLELVEAKVVEAKVVEAKVVRLQQADI